MENKNHPKLERIVYVSIPENSEQDIDGFKIDTSILLPVEIPIGIPIEETNWQMQDLSWEMIIAGMLKILAWDSNHKYIEYYRNFIDAVKPEINEELTKTGIIKVNNKDFEIAEEIFRALANYHPDIEQNLTNLALLFEEQADLYENLKNFDLAEKKIEDAFEIYKKVLKIHPNSETAIFNAGNFYLKNGNLDKAKNLLKHYLSISKDSKKQNHVKEILKKIDNLSTEDTVFSEAYELIKIGREESGITKIKQFIKSNENVWNAWFLLGWAYRRIGDYRNGKEALLKCLNLNNENIDTYNELSICYLELGDYAECRKKLSQALRLDGDNIKIISNFGILALKENKQEEALGFFKTVLEIEPDDDIAQKYVEFLLKQ